MIVLLKMTCYHDDIEISFLIALIITALASSNSMLLKTSQRLMMTTTMNKSSHALHTSSNICSLLSMQMKSLCVKLQSIVKGRQWMHCNYPFICKVCTIYGKNDDTMADDGDDDAMIFMVIITMVMIMMIMLCCC